VLFFLLFVVQCGEDFEVSYKLSLKVAFFYSLKCFVALFCALSVAFLCHDDPWVVFFIYQSPFLRLHVFKNYTQRPFCSAMKLIFPLFISLLSRNNRLGYNACVE